jgi:ribosome maturation factor RimP
LLAPVLKQKTLSQDQDILNPYNRFETTPCIQKERCGTKQLLFGMGVCFGKWAEDGPLFFCLSGVWAIDNAIIKKVQALAEPVLTALGLEWVDAVYGGSRPGGHLRITIDKRVGGVTVDDCAQVSRYLGRALDVEEAVPHRYTLEVSSPGLDRKLVRPEDFVRFTGRKVRVKTQAPTGVRAVLVGRLIDFKDEALVLDLEDGEQRTIPLSDVAEARLEVEF